MMDRALTEKRARMACRLYLKLFDAGARGTSVVPADAIGPADREPGDETLADEVFDQILNTRHVDNLRVIDGITYAEIVPDMNSNLAREIRPGFSMADRVREVLRQVDRGEDVGIGPFTQFEPEIRGALSPL